MVSTQGTTHKALIFNFQEKVQVLIVNRNYSAVKGAIFSHPGKSNLYKAKEMSNFVHYNLDKRINPEHLSIIIQHNQNRLN